MVANDDPLRLYKGLLESTGQGADPLPALATLAALRAHLDVIERQLIESAREREASWATIAQALGLASRQAAEQRLLRLSGERSRDPGPARHQRGRQQSVDRSHGPELAKLRPAVATLARQLTVRPNWTLFQPRAALALSTLSVAETAEPGALFSLAVQALSDLDTVPTTAPDPVAAARERLRAALVAATP